ncbi:MAG: VOC family protein [Xanthobacteraceae bacterium]
MGESNDANSSYRSYFDCHAGRARGRGARLLPRHSWSHREDQTAATGRARRLLVLGVDKNFVAAGKAHPAFIVDGLADMVTKLKQAGYRVTEDEPLPGCDRRHVHDPFGNRIELIEPHAR